MNSETPKQFLLLAGKPLLMHALGKFYEADASLKIIVVLPAKEIEEWKSLCEKYSFRIAHQVTAGGETRYMSVKNGLALVGGKSVVAIHDGARPLASVALIRKCFSVAAQKGNAVPCLPVRESMRKISEGKNELADRSGFVTIQTPQCFASDILKKAYEGAFKSFFTDDASVVEAAGEAINLVEGEQENIKVTFPIDLGIAEAIIRKG